MKKLMYTLLLFSAQLLATNYHVSNSGSDSNDGLTTSTPWATIAKVNTEIAGMSSGDSILFDKDGVYYGEITIIDGQNGRKISSYGIGDKPVLSVLDTVDTWNNYSGDIYYSIVGSDLDLQMVLVDGVIKSKAQSPNTGYYEYETFSGITSITDNELTGNWIGAELALTKNSSTIERCLITNQTGTTLDYVSYALPDDVKDVKNTYNDYRLQNSLQCIDVDYEWVYSNDTLYMQFPSTPAELVEYANKDYVINVNRADNISVENIIIRGSNGYGIRIDSAAINTIVDNCEIYYTGHKAVEIWGSGSSFTNNIVKYCFGGVDLNISGSVSNNTIDSIGLWFGQVDAITYSCGIYILGANPTIEYNALSNLGYMAISRINTGYNNVRYNYTHNWGNLLLDCGAYYFGGEDMTGTNVYNNIAINDNGSGFGIYLDNGVEGVGVYDNFVKGAYYGIHNHKAVNDTIYNNTIAYSTNTGADWYNSDNSQTTATGNYFYGNILIDTVLTLAVKSEYNLPDALQMATSDNNYFFTSNAQPFLIDGGTPDYSTLSEWQGDGFDTNSSLTASYPNIRYNTSFTENVTLSNDSIYTFVDGSIQIGGTILPMSSEVFINVSKYTPPQINSILGGYYGGYINGGYYGGSIIGTKQ